MTCRIHGAVGGDSCRRFGPGRRESTTGVASYKDTKARNAISGPASNVPRPRLSLDRLGQPAARPGHPTPDDQTPYALVLRVRCGHPAGNRRLVAQDGRRDRRARRRDLGLCGSLHRNRARHAASLSHLADSSTPAAHRAAPLAAAGRTRSARRPWRRRRASPPLPHPPAAKRNPSARSDSLGDRRPAAGPGLGRALDRPSLRFSLHRPRR